MECGPRGQLLDSNCLAQETRLKDEHREPQACERCPSPAREVRIDHGGKHEEGRGWGWSLRSAGLAGAAGDPDVVEDIEALAGCESSVGCDMAEHGRAWQDEKLAMAQKGRYAEAASPLFLSENLGLHRGGAL